MLNSVGLPQLMTESLARIKGDGWFPYRTGDLMKSTHGRLVANGFDIVFDGNALRERNRVRFKKEAGTNYIPFLEYGTKRSRKHEGFIRVKSVDTILDVLKKHSVKMTIEYRETSAVGGFTQPTLFGRGL